MFPTANQYLDRLPGEKQYMFSDGKMEGNNYNSVVEGMNQCNEEIKGLHLFSSMERLLQFEQD